MSEPNAAFTLALALAVGVVAQSMARHLRVPGIILLLAAGVGLGPDGLGWILPRMLGEGGLFATVDLAVAVILFEGGLNLERARLRRTQTAIRRLISMGALVTLLGGALAASWLLDWDRSLALLFGSLVVVTGPTVIGPLVSELRLRPKVATVLEAEGVLIDPIGAILAVLMLELAIEPDAFASQGMHVIWTLGFGGGAGIVVGLMLGGLLRLPRLIPEGFGNIFALATVLVLFQGCEQVIAHSGILAVTVAGIAVGNLGTRVDRDLREFKDQLTVLLIGLLFVLLAADVRFADVRALGVPGLAVVGALVFVVRPLNVLVSTAGSALSWRERMLIGWIAPRGIVAAAIASLVAGALESHGHPGGVELRALVFLTITGTVVLAGATALPVAWLLDQRLPGRQTVAILGASGLGLQIALALREGGVPVVLLDSNPDNARRAQELELPVVFGNALHDRTMQRARFESVGACIGATPNESLNGMFTNRAHQYFQVPDRYVALLGTASGVTKEILEGQGARALFEVPHDVERWEVRARHGEMEVERRVFEGAAPEPEAEQENAERPAVPGELFAILTIHRGGRVVPMWSDFKVMKGDVASIAIHLLERTEAHAMLDRLGWAPVPAEDDAPDAPDATATTDEARDG